MLRGTLRTLQKQKNTSLPTKDELAMQIKKIMFQGLLLIVLLQTGCGQSAISKPGTKQEPMQPVTYLNDWELPAAAKAAWDTLFKDFLDNRFAPELAKRKLRQDCKICGDIFYEYQFSVSAEGRMVDESKIREEIDCNDVPAARLSDLENTLLGYFKEIKFPEALHGLHIKARIGKLTKC